MRGTRSELLTGRAFGLLSLCAAFAVLAGCASKIEPPKPATIACADPHWTEHCPSAARTQASSQQTSAPRDIRRPRGVDNSPFLPWPPPKPTRMGDISGPFVIAGRLAEIDRQIRARLVRHGYQELRYFAVPGGFGITTNLERLDSRGRPSADRWLIGKTGGWSSLFSYFASLMKGETAQFRLLAIIVTNEELQPAPFPVTQTDTERWQLSGMPYLSSSRGRLPVAQGTKVWLLVYEFAPGRSKGTALVADEEGQFPFSVHAKALGIP
jgi:hypothetical protein